MAKRRKLDLVAKDSIADSVLFSISIPSDSRAPIVQELLKQCLDAFPHNEIEVVISTKSSVGVAGAPFMAYESSREFRREFTKRTQEGIAAAKERGVQFGRKPKTPPPQYNAIFSEWKAKQISASKAARKLGVSCQTFLKWTRESKSS